VRNTYYLQHLTGHRSNLVVRNTYYLQHMTGHRSNLVVRNTYYLQHMTGHRSDLAVRNTAQTYSSITTMGKPKTIENIFPLFLSQRSQITGLPGGVNTSWKEFCLLTVYADRRRRDMCALLYVRRTNTAITAGESTPFGGD